MSSLLPLVDTHFHLWDFQSGNYPWLLAELAEEPFQGDLTPIKRDYLLDEFLDDAKDQNLIASVHVQAEFDHARAVEETAWLQQLTDRAGFPQAIVAYADLAGGDVAGVLEDHAKYPAMRGIRQILNWHPDPLKDYGLDPSLMTSADWQRGFALLAGFGMSFDLQIYPHQLRDAAELAGRHPGVSIVLDHCGMPIDRDDDSLRVWRDGLRQLAQHDNVAAKISALTVLDHSWTPDSIRPYVETTIDAFGPERCMLGSDFPVDKLHATYDQLMGAYRELISDLTVDEQASVLSGTAMRVYRITVSARPGD